ncbi:class I SAM-dependent methyltransferase [Sphingomonas crocodyli]|uniref:Methyltransferase domain-containing protein n=1 Tax=Sphingomonas crocodyli TaxID=1979270 RepID=A0A437M8F9_9SPHN|nr:class I SAM-dependent methyltransferase [Sphingomonas crocodyli]RVT93893.1 methyltransferase domain-containing protein [Sphingomonas crocodyli]
MIELATPEGAADAARLHAIDASRRAYAVRWAINAAWYERQGLYDRLAAIATGHGPIGRAIDLGCGQGHGTAALLRRAPSMEILGIDENPHGLRIAGARMPRSVRWLHSDLLDHDPEREALLDVTPIDLISLWFPGTHAAREQDATVRRLNLVSDELYAVAMEMTAILIAARHLRPGGLLHIVDRAAHPDPERIRHVYRDKMARMAGRYGLHPIDICALPYAEPQEGGIAIGSPRFDRDPSATFAISMLLRRSESVERGS